MTDDMCTCWPSPQGVWIRPGFTHNERCRLYSLRDPRCDYCGCCGNEIDPSGPDWCPRCAEHIARWPDTPFARTYFAQHGEDCPFQVGRETS